MIRPFVLVMALAVSISGDPGVGAQAQSEDEPRLVPTPHAPLPAQPSQFWLAPDQAARTAAARDAAVAKFARGAKLIADGDHAAGLPLVRATGLEATPYADYAQYYAGIALAALGRYDEAASLLAALDARDPAGFLEQAVPLQRADVAISRMEAGTAEDILEDLSDEKLSAPEEVFLRLGRAAEANGNREAALKAYRHVYYEFPLSTQASDAQTGIERLETPALLAPDRFKLELARAQELFDARRWAQARAGFAPLMAAATGDTRGLIALRLAECDYYLDRFRASRDALVPFLDDGPRRAEARFFHLTATRALGDETTYVALARKFVADFPESTWAEETLNNLASHYIIGDEDAEADRVFRELLVRFPKSRYAERASWRSGWWAYRSEDFADAAALFEQAASSYPRSDYRPAWLYWSGRAREQMGDRAAAMARYRLVVTDYQNTYYGRLSTRILEARREAAVQPVLAANRTTVAPGGELPTAALIRALAAAGLYDDALREVQYAQRVWGDSPVLMATSAWLRHQQGLGLKATDRFMAMRGAINTMRRAYPQFMAAGGETLPPDILRIIFPLDYWPLIRKYADQHKLDPYLMAALMAQESTFTAEIRSHANAYGLMQVIPDTGRRVARQLGIRRFSTASLTNPETNVRIGMKYFKDLTDKFGGAHFALASYNAGPHRVARWLEEAPGLPQDEFIDNIPFAETQTYVKRILGTAEDYRRLYGEQPTRLKAQGAGLN